ncbi:MAG: hypothetical protein KAZ88_14410 [Acidimicrobiia bacterium]|nr:hypothetical protein [Acidimicrobiia bacterium]
MRVAISALKRGHDPNDIFHAIDNAIAVTHLDDDVELIVGPARNGALLEVAIREGNTVFHCMPARAKFLR